MNPSLKLSTLLERIQGGLIVSCQAEADEPMHGAQQMAAMAAAAAMGGAKGIRANTPQDIAAIRQRVSLPIIGIYKQDFQGTPVRITPTIMAAVEVAQAGADIIAIDATSRPHPDGIPLDERIRAIHEQTGCPIMADISTYEEGLAAEQWGADIVATTLSGYTQDSQPQETPDFKLLKQLVAILKAPIVAEGRIVTPEQAAEALGFGAFAVVVGSAITRPQWITRRFVQGIKTA